jgi:hypothetical protein
MQREVVPGGRGAGGEEPAAAGDRDASSIRSLTRGWRRRKTPPEGQWAVASSPSRRPVSAVAAGYLERDDDAYALPPEHPAAPAALVTAFDVPASMWLDQEQAIEAFRTGAGVPWGEAATATPRG